MTLEETERQIRVSMNNALKALVIANMSLKKTLDLIEQTEVKPKIKLVVNNQ